ncbi:hypothetical protein VNO77_29750 [Canavalia gladiata]|uniref:Uncharacterized protein n=1 Tax=Canavalia gladiata TaxID=3824 RepID=A0AAN9KR60_CANGL
MRTFLLSVWNNSFFLFRVFSPNSIPVLYVDLVDLNLSTQAVKFLTTHHKTCYLRSSISAISTVWFGIKIYSISVYDYIFVKDSHNISELGSHVLLTEILPHNLFALDISVGEHCLETEVSGVAPCRKLQHISDKRSHQLPHFMVHKGLLPGISICFALLE